VKWGCVGMGSSTDPLPLKVVMLTLLAVMNFCTRLLNFCSASPRLPLDASSSVKIVTICIPLTKAAKTLGATVLVILKAKQP
jgi:hypothetical protein